MEPKIVVVRLRPGSDGDPTHLPKEGKYTELNPPTFYLEKIGQQWMEARGEARSGTKYILESLPAGYSLWHRPRPSTPSHFDKYLFGHPSRKSFDSPNRFYPHFEYLMNNAGDSMGCPCTVCAGNAGVLPKSSRNSNMRWSSTSFSRDASPQASSRLHEQLKSASHLSQISSNPPVQPMVLQHKGRHKTMEVGMDLTRVDEEGTPDIYRNLIDKLRYHSVDEKINEPMSLDWRSEQHILPEWMGKLKDPQWHPRTGEIVLYVRGLLPPSMHIMYRSATGNFQIYDEKLKEWAGIPVWEAGLVVQTPTKPPTTEDICEDGDKQSNVTYYGLRVEPLPSVNNADKSLSKRHVYIPLRQIRPFIFWKQILRQVSKEEWHPTILNALTVTSSFSLLGKHRFRGSWPNAYIYCHGVYIGYELLAVGDTVRLLPRQEIGKPKCTDIMEIKSIRLKLSDLDQASNNDWDNGQPYKSEVWIYGTAYTSDMSRSSKEWFSEHNSQPPKASGGYTEWYPLHPASKELAVTYNRVLGRLFEYEETVLWLNSKADADSSSILDAGRKAILAGRKYSQQHDKRIVAAAPGVTWYWGDSRSQALDLHTINNIDVAKYDQKRDPREYRKKIKVLEAMVQDKPPAISRNLQAFTAPSDPDLMGPTELSRRMKHAGTTGSSTASSTTGERSLAGGKRPRAIDLSDTEGGYESEEEIRRNTKIVGDDLVAEKKKRFRVMVVIDQVRRG